MSNTVLYRKYRPMHFRDVYGQEHVVNILSQALAKDRVAHAYLFSGPRGSGKTSIARILARAVNCVDEKKTAKNAPPCNVCDSCKEFMSAQTLDLVEIDAASNRGIDEVRALKENVGTLPFRASRKVYIIDEVHMMTREAFNALLKVLEEPPAHVMFIMATTEPEKVLDTIVSRTQHLRFHPLSERVVKHALEDVAKKEGISLEPEAAALLSFLSEGSLRDGLNLLLQAHGVAGETITAQTAQEVFGAPSQELIDDIMDAIAKRNSEKAFQAIRKTEGSSVSHTVLLNLLLRNFRYLLLVSLQPKFTETLRDLVSESEYEAIIAKKDALNSGELRGIVATLLYTANVRYQSPYPSLPLELGVAKILSLLEKKQQ